MRKSTLIFCQRNDFDLYHTRELISLRNGYAGYDLVNRSRFTQDPKKALQLVSEACRQKQDEIFLLTGMIYEIKDRKFWDGGLAVKAKEVVEKSKTLLYTAVYTSSLIKPDERKLFNLVFEKRKVDASTMIDYIIQLMHPEWRQETKDALLTGFP